MTKEYRDKVYRIIYNNVAKKHPDWPKDSISIAARWRYQKSMKPKMIKRCNNVSD